MNDYFVNITKTIGLKQFQFNHLSNRFKSNLDNVSDKFDFQKVYEEEVKREMQHVKVLYQPKFLKKFATHIFP